MNIGKGLKLVDGVKPRKIRLFTKIESKFLKLKTHPYSLVI